MDIERIVAKRLMDATGVGAVLEIPSDRPSEFISVELTGGNWLDFGKQAIVSVYEWAPTRKRAAEIASIVEQSVPLLLAEENIFDAFSDGSYRMPDPESGGARYKTNVNLTIFE